MLISTQIALLILTVNQGVPAGAVPVGYHLNDLIIAADHASRQGDYKAASRYYKALAKAAPDRKEALAHLCQAYKELGQAGKAAVACRATPETFATVTKVILAEPKPAGVDVRILTKQLKAEPAPAPMMVQTTTPEVPTRRWTGTLAIMVVALGGALTILMAKRRNSVQPDAHL